MKLDERDLKEISLNSWVETTAKIVSVENHKGDNKLKKKGKLKTQGGEIKFKLWFNEDLKEGDIVHLKNAHLKKFAGQIEIEINKGNIVDLHKEKRKTKNDKVPKKKIYSGGGNPFNNFQGDIGPNSDNKNRWD